MVDFCCCRSSSIAAVDWLLVQGLTVSLVLIGCFSPLFTVPGWPFEFLPWRQYTATRLHLWHRYSHTWIQTCDIQSDECVVWWEHAFSFTSVLRAVGGLKLVCYWKLTNYHCSLTCMCVYWLLMWFHSDMCGYNSSGLKNVTLSKCLDAVRNLDAVLSPNTTRRQSSEFHYLWHGLCILDDTIASMFWHLMNVFDWFWLGRVGKILQRCDE